MAQHKLDNVLELDDLLSIVVDDCEDRCSHDVHITVRETPEFRRFLIIQSGDNVVWFPL